MTDIPTTLPDNPLPLFAAWLDHAWHNANVPNPNAMSLSSVAMVDGIPHPSSRMLLLKELVTDSGAVIFYTNYLSRKGKELLPGTRACALLHWDHLEQQIRLEGLISRIPESHSDRYFASRDRQSRIGAWASNQSDTLASREELLEKFAQVAARFEPDDDIPRPPYWGGLQLTIDRLELWSGGEFRIHDRALWQRQLSADYHLSDAVPGPWESTRLQP